MYDLLKFISAEIFPLPEIISAAEVPLNTTSRPPLKHPYPIPHHLLSKPLFHPIPTLIQYLLQPLTRPLTQLHSTSHSTSIPTPKYPYHTSPDLICSHLTSHLTIISLCYLILWMFLSKTFVCYFQNHFFRNFFGRKRFRFLCIIY